MKKLKIQPLRLKKADKEKTFRVSVPGSKSYTNRALLTAALAKGKSKLTNVLFSDDTEVMITALKKLGVKISRKGSTLIVKGCNGKFKKPKGELYFGNAGTAIRFMAAALAIQDFECKITGSPRMKNRPIRPLVDALRQGGAKIEYLGTEGFPPIKIKGGFKGGRINVTGETSSQFISSLLLTSPYTQKLTDIVVKGHVASKPYIDVTIQVMRSFGVTKGKRVGYRRFVIKNGTSYNAIEYEIEADASSASYFFAFAAIHGIKIKVKNAKYTSAQGDIKLVNLLQKAGCKVTKKDIGITVKGPEGKPKALGNVDMNSMPDVALTMAIVAAFSEGRTRLMNIPNLRVKECDRILAITSELIKINCKARQMAEGIEVKGHSHKYRGAEIDTYDDHRIAMCFGIVGTKVPGIIIRDPDCVSKTYPNFWKDLEKLGVQVKEIPENKTKK